MDEGEKVRYVKFRYDFTDMEMSDVTISHVMEVIYRLLSPKGDGSVYSGVVGVENKNRYGEVIKTHMHYSFMTTEKPESIRRRFMRTKSKKVESYSLAEETDVVDFNRFFRYALKQYDPSTFEYKYYSRIPLPPNFDLMLQQHFAYDEWERGTQILSKARVKRDSRASVYERIIDQVAESGVIFLDLRQVQDYVLDYFLDNNLPPDRNKIMNMADGLAIRSHIIDRDDYFRR